MKLCWTTSRYGLAGEWRRRPGSIWCLKPAVRDPQLSGGGRGIDVPVVLGSRCTDLKVGIGGLEGRRLQDGDRLKLGKASRRFSTSRGVKSLPIGNRIRALPGPEYHEFDRASQGVLAFPGSLAPRATGWDIACRANRLRAPPIAKCFRTACCRGGTGSA